MTIALLVVLAFVAAYSAGAWVDRRCEDRDLIANLRMLGIDARRRPDGAWEVSRYVDRERA